MRFGNVPTPAHPGAPHLGGLVRCYRVDVGAKLLPFRSGRVVFGASATAGVDRIGAAALLHSRNAELGPLDLQVFSRPGAAGRIPDSPHRLDWRHASDGPDSHGIPTGRATGCVGDRHVARQGRRHPCHLSDRRDHGPVLAAICSDGRAAGRSSCAKAATPVAAADCARALSRLRIRSACHAPPLPGVRNGGYHGIIGSDRIVGFSGAFNYFPLSRCQIERRWGWGGLVVKSARRSERPTATAIGPHSSSGLGTSSSSSRGSTGR